MCVIGLDYVREALNAIMSGEVRARSGMRYNAITGPLPPGAWYDAYSRGKRYPQLLEGLKSGRLLEFEANDVAKSWRGNLLGEIIGQTLDPDTGYPIIHVAILAGSNREVFAWGVPNLGAPNGIHICRRPADQLEEISSDDAYVLMVERCRIVKKGSLPEDRMEPAAADGGDMPRASSSASRARRDASCRWAATAA